MRKDVPTTFLGKLYLKICLIVMLIGTVSVIYDEVNDLLNKQKILKTIETHIRVLRVKNISAAYEFTSESFKKNTDIDSFTKFIEGNTCFFSNKRFRCISRKINKGLGYVYGYLVSAGDSEQKVTYQLIREGKMWRISYISLSDKL